MPRMLRTLTATVAVLGLVTAGAVAKSGSGKGGDAPKAAKVLTLDPSTNGNPEGVAVDRRNDAFFVGSLGNGTIYRGTLKDTKLVPYIDGAAGRVAVGMKVKGGKLYVAGGGTGKLLVFDIATKAQVASFDTGTGGFLNDLVVTPAGDVWVTDSFRPTLWKITAAQVAAGTGTPLAVNLAPDVTYQSGFNVNGIVALDEGRKLLVSQTNTGALYRIVPAKDGSANRTITKVDAPAVNADGMIIDRGRLVAVASGQLVFLNLKSSARRAVVTKRVTDPSFRSPSTVGELDGKYIVVNADFATNTQPFTVSVLRRR